MSSQHAQEVEAGGRFAFGDNWWRFLASLDDTRILKAEESLRAMLRVEHLRGRRFLDGGSGSGVFRLAARRLGAAVHSFDYDPQSVACTRELKRRYFADDPQWRIEEGSALANVAPTVAPGGQLVVAIYNDQGMTSSYWSGVKRVYNRNHALRLAMVAVHAPYLVGVRWLVRAATNRLALDGWRRACVMSLLGCAPGRHRQEWSDDVQALLGTADDRMTRNPSNQAPALQAPGRDVGAG